MLPTLACVVEGHGDVMAVPLLVARLASAEGHPDLFIPRPVRCPKSKIVRTGNQVDEDELRRAIEYATYQLPSRSSGAVLIILDSDEECPAILGPGISGLAKKVRGDVYVSVVIAKREYEAWLIAAIESLRGKGGIREDANPPIDPEGVADAKGHLTDQMIGTRRYSETVDQPALTQLFDLQQADRCDSFRKLRRELAGILEHLYPEPS